MKPEQLKKLIDGKRRWGEQLTPEDKRKGFRGWYSSKALPHFDSPGAQQFLTYRLADSLPAARRSEWERFIAIENSLEKQQRLQAYLDLGHGCCLLRDERIANLVQGSLWHDDGVNYRLCAWVVMPNHVHVLIEVWHLPLGKIMQSWKGYTAKEANKMLGREGIFWEEDCFDRYIRDEEHSQRVVRYIEGNPVKAGLTRSALDWPWSSSRFRLKEDSRALTHPGAERFPGRIL